MRYRGFVEWRRSFTPWELVKQRFFDGRGPSILAFSERHGLDVIEVMKLFSGETISFSLKMCEALSNEIGGVSKDLFRNLSNRWPPHPPPAESAALSRAPFSFYKISTMRTLGWPRQFLSI